MEKQIQKWLEKGLLDAEKSNELLNDYKEESKCRYKKNIQLFFCTIGALLLGFAVISFIASNSWILELFNFSIIAKVLIVAIVSIVALYFGHSFFVEKDNKIMGKSLIILSSLLIGATYALVGQAYNFNNNSATLIFLWCISVIPIAYFYKINAANVLAIILFILAFIFYYKNLGLDNFQTWTVFTPVLLGTLFYTIGNIPSILEKYNYFSLTYKLVGLSSIFITLLVLIFSVEKSYKLIDISYILPVVFLLVVNCLLFALRQNKTRLFIFEQSFILTLLFSQLILLSIASINSIAVTIIAHLFLMLIIMAMFNCGYKYDSHRLISLGSKFLIIYLISTYARFSWGFLDKTAFFVLGGTIFLCVGILLQREHKRLEGKNEE